MRIVHDAGRGSSRGRYLTLIIGPGAGYCRRWWLALNHGPGLAVQAATPCGHGWPRHCNSAHCVRWWCRSFPLYFSVLVTGAALRVWLGPTYWRGRGLWARFRWAWRCHRQYAAWEGVLERDHRRRVPLRLRVWGASIRLLLLALAVAPAAVVWRIFS